MVNLGHVRGNGISNISYSLDGNGNTVVTVTLDDNTTKTFVVNKGVQGEQGEQGLQGENGLGIDQIYLENTSGLEKTYCIRLTDTSIFRFKVRDGVGSEYAPVDTVEDGNMKPVTSNAVFDYIESVIGEYEEDMSS